MILEIARVSFGDLLKMLGVSEIPGCDDASIDWIELLDCVDVDERDLPKTECDICGGEEPDEPMTVDPWLINEFVDSIRRGDIRTARCLVERVFPGHESATLADKALCRIAA